MAWLSGWTKRKLVTLARPSALLSDYPFAAQVAADMDIGAIARADGYDIRFTASDGSTLLNYERDVWSVAGGAATALWHVGLPSWSAVADTAIYCYYGKADAPDVSSGPNTFDSNHVGVYHGGDGTTISVQDSSPAGNHGTNSGATAAAGQVGGAMSFDGNDYISLGSGASLDLLSTDITISAWVKTATNGNQVIVARNLLAWWFAVWGDFKLLWYSENAFVITAANAVDNNTWTHVAARFTASGSTVEFFKNGASLGAADATPADVYSTYPKPAVIGADPRSDPPRGYNLTGLLDELRTSNNGRSDAWIAAEYGTIAAPATWQTWGAEESNVTSKPWLYAARRSQIIGAGA